MTKYAYQQFVFTGTDDVAVAPFAAVTVTNAADDSPADIWEDADGLNQITGGELLADDEGYFIFYADPGTYNVTITSGGDSKTLTDVTIAAGSGEASTFYRWRVADESAMIALVLTLTAADVGGVIWVESGETGFVFNEYPLSDNSLKTLMPYIVSVNSGVDAGGPYFQLNYSNGTNYRAYLSSAVGVDHISGSGPWASLPDPAANNGKIYRLSDSWANNALAYSDGTRWRLDRPVTIYANSPIDVVSGVTGLTAFRNVMIPGKLLGKNGTIKIDPIWKYTSNSNAKNAGYRISQAGGVSGGTQMWQHHQSSSSTSSLPLIMSADNSETAQVAATSAATNGSVGQSSAATEVSAAVDTTQDWYITMTIAPTSAGDTCTLRRLVITLNPVYD